MSETPASLIDPRDADAVAAAVAVWLGQRYGDVGIAEPPSSIGAGFDSFIHFVRYSGEGLPLPLRAPLVARVLPDADRLDGARREADIANWCAEGGYPAARVLELIAPGDALSLPVQLIERAAGSTMLGALTSAPWRAAALVDRLGDLHAQLHEREVADCPLADHPDGTLVARRLALPRRVGADHAEIAAALARVEELAGRMESRDPRVCHGDFHPLNVVVDGDAAVVIDWSDAGVGDRHGDVARTSLLFRVAAVAAENRAERAALRLAGPWLSRRYLRAYERRLPLDRTRVALFEPLHLLHGWAQVTALAAGMFANADPDGGRADRLPRNLGAWLRGRFEAAMARLDATA